MNRNSFAHRCQTSALAGLFCLLAGVPVSAAVSLDLPDRPFPSEVEEAARREGHVESQVRFPSPVKTRFEANNTVWGRYYRPDGEGPFAGVLVLPIMAAPNDFIEQRFIKRLVSDRFAVLFIETPFQFHRRPDPTVPSGQVFLGRTAESLARNFRQSALDARRALSWLEDRPEVDASRLGLLGVSLGAMVAAAVYSVDPRPKYAVFMLGGADFPGLAAESSMTAPFLGRSGIRPDDLRRAWEGMDPLDHMEANAAKPALLINASWDRVVPKANALKLKEAFPSGRQVWVPFGHYSAIIHLLWIPRYVSRDFRTNL